MLVKIVFNCYFYLVHFKISLFLICKKIEKQTMHILYGCLFGHFEMFYSLASKQMNNFLNTFNSK